MRRNSKLSPVEERNAQLHSTLAEAERQASELPYLTGKELAVAIQALHTLLRTALQR